ncbi:MAG: ribokinase [FCB group bacterium]|jgi:ribokinase|nr:ribokinase [FCB group bacterium]
MSQNRIIVVGSANIDLVTRVPRCPRAGETLIGASFQTVCGGKGANQAVAAARLGAETTFVGCVGADAFGDMLIAGLKAENIDVSHVKISPDKPSGTATILVGDDGQNSIVVTPSANFELTPEDIEPLSALFEKATAVLVQLEIPLGTVMATLALAKRWGVLSILDAGPAQKVPQEILRKACVVSPNETEAEALTGIRIETLANAEAAADYLMEQGVREVVLKIGASGAYYAGEIENIHVPAFPIQPVDTTAAGDAFTAALATVWGRTPAREALRFANAAGALAAMGEGAQPSMPTRSAVKAFLKKHETQE